MRGGAFVAVLCFLTLPVSGALAQDVSPSVAPQGIGFSTLDGTDWTLLEMAGRDLPSDARIGLSLRSERARGRVLCNADVADFVTNGTALSFGRPTATTTDCERPDLGARYLDALGGTVTYLLDDGDGRSRLTLFQGDPIPGLVFTRSSPATPLPGTSWRGEDGFTLRFGDGVVSGTTSCGDWVGSYGTDGDWLHVDVAIGSALDCDHASEVFREELLWVTSYLVDDEGLHLAGRAGETVLSFRPE